MDHWHHVKFLAYLSPGARIALNKKKMLGEEKEIIFFTEILWEQTMTPKLVIVECYICSGWLRDWKIFYTKNTTKEKQSSTGL